MQKCEEKKMCMRYNLLYKIINKTKQKKILSSETDFDNFLSPQFLELKKPVKDCEFSHRQLYTIR